jgi:hypothetical protein
VLIASALVVRYVLTVAKDRLPGWMLAVRVYVDALWVFLGVSLAANRGVEWIVDPGKWLSQRRIVVWFNDTRAELFSHFQLAEHVWDILMWAVRTVFGGATRRQRIRPRGRRQRKIHRARLAGSQGHCPEGARVGTVATG